MSGGEVPAAPQEPGPVTNVTGTERFSLTSRPPGCARTWSGTSPCASCCPTASREYVSSFLYTMGVLALAGLIVAVLSGALIALGGVSLAHEQLRRADEQHPFLERAALLPVHRGPLHLQLLHHGMARRPRMDLDHRRARVHPGHPDVVHRVPYDDQLGQPVDRPAGQGRI